MALTTHPFPFPGDASLALGTPSRFRRLSRGRTLLRRQYESWLCLALRRRFRNSEEGSVERLNPGDLIPEDWEADSSHGNQAVLRYAFGQGQAYELPRLAGEWHFDHIERNRAGILALAPRPCERDPFAELPPAAAPRRAVGSIGPRSHRCIGLPPAFGRPSPVRREFAELQVTDPATLAEVQSGLAPARVNSPFAASAAAAAGCNAKSIAATAETRERYRRVVFIDSYPNKTI